MEGNKSSGRRGVLVQVVVVEADGGRSRRGERAGGEAEDAEGDPGIQLGVAVGEAGGAVGAAAPTDQRHPFLERQRRARSGEIRRQQPGHLLDLEK